MDSEVMSNYHEILGQVIRIHFELSIVLIPSSVFPLPIQRDEVDV